ncbi:hypothetical protein HNV28_21090 [Myxococcus xanthus]|uniref:Uncharacterized protein n=2 Tax=Myxococcus xanthus TaxID=34 RepID=A0A7Y4IK48_MYXXA|nr:hypothetical protein [Myxococcus xanthus]NOJ88044.1 hypothetical protein [Myxococcus xanthus]
MPGAHCGGGPQVGGKEAAMSKKDVLHTPPEAVPTAPDRNADTEDGQRSPRGSPPALKPEGGPAGTPGTGGSQRIIEPVKSPQPYPGFSVS